MNNDEMKLWDDIVLACVRYGDASPALKACEAVEKRRAFFAPKAPTVPSTDTEHGFGVIREPAPPLDAAGKTPGQVAVEALERVRNRLMPVARDKHYEINTRDIHQAIDAEIASLSAPPRPPFAGNDHPHEVGSCSCCDAPPAGVQTIAISPPQRIGPDAPFGIDAAFGITVPTKPTKPAIKIEVTGDVSAESLAKLEAYIKSEILGGDS